MAGSESRVLDTFATILPLTNIEPARLRALETVSTELATRLVRAIYREFKNNPNANAGIETLFSRVEFADRSLSDWIDQILRVYDWLDRNQRSALFCDIVEYVSCSMQGSSTQPGHSLEWYLAQYGFEQSSPVK